MIYFTSDLHFGHSNIIKLCNRPFATVEEMDRALMEGWNKKVKKCDTVYIIGDIIWDKKLVEYYITRLNGKKILIPGNHDHNWAKNTDYHKYFLQVTKYLEINLGGHPVTLCHYPMLEWRESREERKTGYLIHGHIHNRVSEDYLPLYKSFNALNAGADINGFVPVTFEELVENNNKFKLRCLELLNQNGK